MNDSPTRIARFSASCAGLALATCACFGQPGAPGDVAPVVQHDSGCPPKYPLASKKAGEAGLVLVYVLVGADGVAAQTRVEQSSGFERLDQAALHAAACFRYTPGTRAGVPRAMWLPVPIRFELG